MKRLISTLLLAALLCGCLVSGALAGSDDALEQFGSIADTICGLDGPQMVSAGSMARPPMNSSPRFWPTWRPWTSTRQRRITG
ncbi:MAG TPA: hypothetical protein IAD42_01170 [Candidatus Scatomorpha pullistercoris]|uniref:Uncharacterized protein n=1 Tax=Candidatus Scatomorpha pullistercoris TaxID=2840929 RepID=A0A9D1K835_9FIRM|nr:hypothetical protein [Candidatus Scatomorpha pullistercoris]